MVFPKQFLGVMAVASFLVAYPLISQVLSDEPPDRDAKSITLDLLELYYQNAEAMRNYDVSIEKLSFFDPQEKVSKEDSFLGAINHRIVMDWDNQRCLLAAHSYSEGTSSDDRVNEVRFADRFENGVVFSKHIGFEKRPRVENSAFHAFLKRVPMVEMMGLKTYPATLDKPFSQELDSNKKRILDLDIKFRYLPDGTGVRTTVSTKGITTTHFDSKSSMPIYIATVFSDDRIPPSSSTVSYEFHKGVYRPFEIKTREHMMLSDDKTKADGSNIKFLSGRSTIKFKWNQFNEESLQMPDDAVLNGTKDAWDDFIAAK